MFRVKVCGLRDPENAAEVVAAGAEAIGLNFFPGSKRFVELAQARVVAERIRGQAELVGLFVNAELGEIERAASTIGFDWIQLHGDESIRFARDVHHRFGIPLIVACRGTLKRWEDAELSANSELWQTVLMDASVPGAYGGTGATADWQLAATWRETGSIRHLILAGGLLPENVADAIRAVRPTAVDVAGGVEIEGRPGWKDPERVGLFADSARAALDSIDE